MRKVKNQSIIRKIAWATIRENRKKNIVILLAVLLTSAMFTTVFSIGMSMNASSQNVTMRQVGGRSMAGFKQMLPEDFANVQNDPKVKNASYRIHVGTAANKKLAALQTEVYYATDENAQNMFCKPTTGTMPVEKYDAAISTMVLDKLGIPHELGQKVSLALLIGQETVEQEFQLCGFWEGDPVSMAQMCFVSREFCDEVAPTPEVPSQEADDMYTGYWSIDFDFKSSFDITGQTEALIERLGYDLDTASYGVNWAYTASDVDITTLLILGGALLLALLSGYLIIYNIFYINVVADIHSYGLLKTVGTTGRQLRRLVRTQGMFFSVVGIPVGLVIGTLAATLIFPVIMSTSSMPKNSYVFSISPWIYVFSALFTLVTMLLSCSKPCRVAAKVSPVEAVSYTVRDGSKKKHKKRHSISPYSMALAGLGRNKKKVSVVVLSLSLSMILVNSVYTIVHGFDAEKFISHSIVGDFSIQDSSMRNFGMPIRTTNGVSAQDRAYFEQIEGVKQSNIYYQSTMCPLIDTAKQLIQQLEKEGKISQIYQESVDYYKESGQMECGIYGIDSFVLEHMAVNQGTIDSQKFMDGGYAIINASQLLDLTQNEGYLDAYEIGDTVEVEFLDGTKKSYEVMADAEIPYPMSTQSYSVLGLNIFLPQKDLLEHLEDQGAMYSVLQVDPDKWGAAEQAVKEYVEQSENLCYVSKQTYLDQFDGFVRMFYMVGGALSLVLALIGILNFVNAVVTGILARRQELAMMEAVGMTGNQLAAMLVWEGTSYAVFTLIFTVAANYTVIRLLIQTMAGEIWFFTYRPTVLPILICLPFLLGIAAVIPYLAGCNMRKRSVVERMKTAE